MAYQSLYRRYRPEKFSEVRGQEHLVKALRNAVVEGRMGHAYLFSGPRGTGKTSTARILAKVLNCENVIDGEPCGVCTSCQAIRHGSSFDVHELDAASNNGVDAIRDLINKAALGSPGRTKVYILDEVHMLSPAASNALLKTLEEPPDHVVFVLATTDPQKVLATIKSRTQHFEVHLLPASDLASLVDDIAKDAGLDVSPEARDYVLRAGGGSARDTLSALDRVVAAGGVPDDVSALDELVEALCERNTGRALAAVEEALSRGRSPRVLGEDLIGRLRDVFLSAMGTGLARLPESDRERIAEQAQRLGAAGATRALEVIGDSFVGIQDAPDPRIPLEVALVRLTKPEADHSLEAIVERLERLERGLGPLGTPPPPAPRTSHPHVDAARDDTAPDADGGPEADGGPAGDGPPAPGGRPADAARQQLGTSRPPESTGSPQNTRREPRPPSSAPSAPVPGRRSAKRTPAERIPPPPSSATAAASTGTASTGTASTEAGSGAALPSRDDLTLAWGDVVLRSLPPKVKSRFAAGRFITVADGFALFGLPNAVHADRCEEVRSEVEAALAHHFSVPVPLKILVDGDPTPPPASPGSSRRPEPADDDGAGPGSHEDGADIDLTQLTDADVSALSSLDRIAEVFPGVEVIDGSESHGR